MFTLVYLLVDFAVKPGCQYSNERHYVLRLLFIFTLKTLSYCNSPASIAFPMAAFKCQVVHTCQFVVSSRNG